MEGLALKILYCINGGFRRAGEIYQVDKREEESYLQYLPYKTNIIFLAIATEPDLERIRTEKNQASCDLICESCVRQ